MTSFYTERGVGSERTVFRFYDWLWVKPVLVSDDLPWGRGILVSMEAWEENEGLETGEEEKVRERILLLWLLGRPSFWGLVF